MMQFLLGNHAPFILPAYGITLAILVGLIFWVNLAHRSRTKTLAALEKHSEEKAKG